MKKLLFIAVMASMFVCMQTAYGQKSNSKTEFKPDNLFFQELIENISQSKDTNLVIEHGSNIFCAVYSLRGQHESIVINNSFIIIQSGLRLLDIQAEYAPTHVVKYRSDNLYFWKKFRGKIK